MLPEKIMLAFEIIGTISFAVSGALVAIKAGLDIFGVLFIAGITAFGGGICRDLLIGRTPPALFSNFYMFFIAIMAGVLVFIVSYVKRRQFDEWRRKIDHINNFFDAAGLGAFAVMGTEIAFQRGFSNNVFLTITLGMLTAVGGGIFRDILTNTTPYIFKKHVYALAAISGSCVYYALRMLIPGILHSSIIALVLVVTVRMLATKYRWSLPKIHVEKRKK
jgi:uncharacterized membrane protein YeiH